MHLFITLFLCLRFAGHIESTIVEPKMYAFLFCAEGSVIILKLNEASTFNKFMVSKNIHEKRKASFLH